MRKLEEDLGNVGDKVLKFKSMVTQGSGPCAFRKERLGQARECWAPENLGDKRAERQTS